MKAHYNKVEVHPFIKLPDVIVFMRHAECIGNVIKSDERACHSLPNQAFPLTELGILQTEQIAEKLRSRFGENYFDICLHSSYARTGITLVKVLERCIIGNYIVEDSRLDERWDGIFHDMSRTEIDRLYPEQNRLKNRMGYYHFRPVGGENGPDVEQRGRNVLHDIHMSNMKKVFICCHGSWFLHMRRLLEGWNIEEFLANKKNNPPGNCEVYIYRKESDGHCLEMITLEAQQKEVILA